MTSTTLGLIFTQLGKIGLRGSSIIVPKFMHIWMICDGDNIDLSQATFVHPVSTIRVFTILCGGVNIFVPRGVRVEYNGMAICVGFNNGVEDDRNCPVNEAPLGY
jgi:hypothetical protein